MVRLLAQQANKTLFAFRQPAGSERRRNCFNTTAARETCGPTHPGSDVGEDGTFHSQGSVTFKASVLELSVLLPSLALT